MYVECIYNTNIMNKLTPARRAQVLTALVEGNSIRSIVRMTGVAKGTITRLLESAGKVCADYQSEALRNLPCKRIQCDEIWSFVYGKDRNLPREMRESSPFTIGSVWTWTAIDATPSRWFRGSWAVVTSRMLRSSSVTSLRASRAVSR